MTLGAKIRSLREQANLSQQDLAEKLFVSRQTVSRWESGTRTPDLVMAKKIAMILGVTLDELFLGADLEPAAPPKAEPWLDLSALKVMLTGIMLVLIAIGLTVADRGFMDTPAVVFFFAGILTFIGGLLIPWWHRDTAAKNEGLPQKTCPRCGKQHDFDWPHCPHCGHSYETL